MAKDESKRAGDSAKPTPQVASSVPARKPASTAPERNRGDTLAKRASGPRELPPQLGRYRIIKKLGGGGMGTVYLVENTELEREEALKVPHFGEGDDPQLRERFLREARSAAKLDHANLCPVYDAGVQDGFYYLTMRFLKGKLLSDYTGTAQPARKAVEIVTKLAQALEAAHAKGVIHRDLKPSNVMMVGGVGPVVMDFGLAKQVRQEHTKLTQDGSMLGTPAYMPPEQVNGDLERMGPASDVYSLGVILYELLTGRLPFEGTMAMIFGQILYTEPPLPSALVPGLNPALDGICHKAMAKAAAERYLSMKAFAAALMDFLRSTTAPAGAGSEAPTAGDKAAVFQAAAVAPERPPAGNSAVFQAPAVPSQARRSLPPKPGEAQEPSVARPPKRRRMRRPSTRQPWFVWLSSGWLIGGIAGGLLLIGLLGLWASGVFRLKTPGWVAMFGSTRSSGSLRRIMLAMHNHNRTFHSFPPPANAAYDNQGKPLLSWRVHLLPYLDELPLYRQFHQHEPWDSEHNRALLDKMPDVYRSRGTSGGNRTGFVLFLDPQMYPIRRRGPDIRQISDGIKNTLFVVEVGPDLAVPWTRPTDLAFDPAEPLAALGELPSDGILGGFADGAVRRIRPDIKPDVFRALLTLGGGEVIGLEQDVELR